MLQIMKKCLMGLYMQYELVTCIYMFEPWEKKLINGFVALILALLIFSSYMYLPSYIETFLQFITPLPLQTKTAGSPTTATSYATPIIQAEKISIS